MNNGWITCFLGEICDVTTGRRPNVKTNSPSNEMNIPVYGGNGIAWYTNEFLLNIDSPVILTGRVGTLGTYFRVVGKCWVSDNALIIIPRTVDPDFLYYYMKMLPIESLNRGSTQPLLTQSDLKQIRLFIPKDIKKQKKISNVLKILDAKIELNTDINKNLEEQAQALFKSWFIDFEPFGGTMPEDWKVGIADDIITLFDSQRIPLSSNQRENMEKIYPYYGATSLMDYVDKYIFNGKYLLLGEDGTVVDDYGFPILQYVWGKFWVNNHAHILQGRNGFTVESLYLFFKCTNVKSIVTGAVQPKINQANLKSIPAIIPTINVMSNFNNVINPLFSLFRKNVEENSRLATLRDTLLPKLMSGEIDVSKVEISDHDYVEKLSFSGA